MAVWKNTVPTIPKSLRLRAVLTWKWNKSIKVGRLHRNGGCKYSYIMISLSRPIWRLYVVILCASSTQDNGISDSNTQFRTMVTASNYSISCYIWCLELCSVIQNMVSNINHNRCVHVCIGPNFSKLFYKVSEFSVVVLGLGPWPWAVLEDKSWILVLGLGLEGKSLVLAIRSLASWPCDLSDLYCYSRNDVNHFHLQLNNPTLQHLIAERGVELRAGVRPG